MTAQLFIRVTSARTRYTVALVTADGKLVTLVYDGNSAVAKQCAVKYLRRMGYGGWNDPQLVSTSGGGGVRVGLFERLHYVALSGGEVA